MLGQYVDFFFLAFKCIEHNKNKYFIVGVYVCRCMYVYVSVWMEIHPTGHQYRSFVQIYKIDDMR